MEESSAIVNEPTESFDSGDTVINKYKYTFLNNSSDNSLNEKPLPASHLMTKINLECHSILNSKSHFEVLGIEQNASEQEIRNAYRKKSFKFYPKRNPSLFASEAFDKISLAFQSLTQSLKFSLKENKRTDLTKIEPEKCFLMFLKALKDQKEKSKFSSILGSSKQNIKSEREAGEAGEAGEDRLSSNNGRKNDKAKEAENKKSKAKATNKTLKKILALSLVTLVFWFSLLSYSVSFVVAIILRKKIILSKTAIKSLNSRYM